MKCQLLNLSGLLSAVLFLLLSFGFILEPPVTIPQTMEIQALVFDLKGENAWESAGVPGQAGFFRYQVFELPETSSNLHVLYRNDAQVSLLPKPHQWIALPYERQSPTCDWKETFTFSVEGNKLYVRVLSSDYEATPYTGQVQLVFGG